MGKDFYFFEPKILRGSTEEVKRGRSLADTLQPAPPRPCDEGKKIKEPVTDDFVLKKSGCLACRRHDIYLRSV